MSSFEPYTHESIISFIEWVKTCTINEFKESYKTEFPYDITESENLLLRIMCSTGCLEEIKIIVNDNPSLDLRIKNDECFRNACGNGHIELAKWLYTICQPDIAANDNQSFRFACLKGHFEVAQWIYSLNPNITFKNDSYTNFLFGGVCFNGFTLIAKWLLEIIPDIDVHFEDDLSFRHSCIQNHLETAKWLLENFPDINIDAKKHESFINASKKNMVEMAVWLQSLKPDIYNLVFEDNKITNYSIRPNLEVKKQELEETTDTPSEVICPICQDFNTDVKTVCNHHFCYKCINKWYKNNNNVCPMCKTGFLTHVLYI